MAAQVRVADATRSCGDGQSASSPDWKLSAAWLTSWVVMAEGASGVHRFPAELQTELEGLYAEAGAVRTVVCGWPSYRKRAV